MKTAIIGTGIAGLSAAYRLNKICDIQVFEASPQLGGHTATIDFEMDRKQYAIDTGFIVFNDWTYPNFIKLLAELDVQSQPTQMGFSVKCERQGIEYCGAGLNGFFAQRKQMANPSMWRLLKEILRFNQETIRALSQQAISPTQTLNDYLLENNYSPLFKSHYITPMAAAIWSSGSESIKNFPFLFFANFFKNHGLLSLKNRPQWRVVKGGSKSYIAPLVAPFKDKIHTNCPVLSIQRQSNCVVLKTKEFSAVFDQVVIATHSDQALRLLEAPTSVEKEVLSAIPYQENNVTLHTDTRVLPKNRRTWSSWNFLLKNQDFDRPVLTYNMNILQGIHSHPNFCVTLNDHNEIRNENIIGKYNYSHPIFSCGAIKAQDRWQEINGVNRTWFCGAYWHNGFHEDGLNSGLRVARAIGDQLNEQCNLQGHRTAQAL